MKRLNALIVSRILGFASSYEQTSYVEGKVVAPGNICYDTEEANATTTELVPTPILLPNVDVTIEDVIEYAGGLTGDDEDRLVQALVHFTTALKHNSKVNKVKLNHEYIMVIDNRLIYKNVGNITKVIEYLTEVMDTLLGFMRKAKRTQYTDSYIFNISAKPTGLELNHIQDITKFDFYKGLTINRYNQSVVGYLKTLQGDSVEIFSFVNKHPEAITTPSIKVDKLHNLYNYRHGLMADAIAEPLRLLGILGLFAQS